MEQLKTTPRCLPVTMQAANSSLVCKGDITQRTNLIICDGHGGLMDQIEGKHVSDENPHLLFSLPIALASCFGSKFGRTLFRPR